MSGPQLTVEQHCQLTLSWQLQTQLFFQKPRVARERGVSEAEVQQLVQAAATGRDLGFIGAPSVDVLELNLALDREVG